MIFGTHPPAHLDLNSNPSCSRKRIYSLSMDTSCTGSAQPCAIVSPQFCTPRPMDLIFNTQAPGLNDGDVEVKVMGGNDVFKAVRSSRSLENRFRREMLLFFNGSRVISMQEKKLSGHSRWQAFMVDRPGRKDKLFTVKEASAFHSRTELEVFLAKNRREKKCDFKIMGSYDNKRCAIHQANPFIVVAQMNVEHMVANMPQGEHHFGMHVNPNIDYCFIVALTVILHEIHHNTSTSEAMLNIAEFALQVIIEDTDATDP